MYMYTSKHLFFWLPSYLSSKVDFFDFFVEIVRFYQQVVDLGA